MDNTIPVSDVNLDVIQMEIQTLQSQFEQLTYQQELTNTILLYIIGIAAAVGVCLLLYHVIKIFF